MKQIYLTTCLLLLTLNLIDAFQPQQQQRVKPQNKYEPFSTSYLRTLLPYGGGHNNVYYRRPSQQQEFDLRRQQIDEDPSETESSSSSINPTTIGIIK
ncbi:hypothetical protein HUG17_5517 [Dermatophagoides farinae]|uniref:Secreted protein n=1 Tax=Dermatophagoides farinae TaxID=6954 RepID=A0A9D4SHU8_DERFA|nr:hypothetical protein HUG17_5517 [Dermatophagoides farinae]